MSVIITLMMIIFVSIFVHRRNSLRGSAVCAFKMADIVSSFERSHKEQKTAHSNWLPVRNKDIPSPHPAKVCVCVRARARRQ